MKGRGNRLAMMSLEMLCQYFNGVLHLLKKESVSFGSMIVHKKSEGEGVIKNEKIELKKGL